MKKIITISSLVLLTVIFFATASQAQQQKPSERSFTAEINKVKEKQAARNKMIAKMQQTINETPATVTQPQSNAPVINPAGQADSKTSTSTNQQNKPSATQTSNNKPSNGPMKKPVFP